MQSARKADVLSGVCATPAAAHGPDDAGGAVLFVNGLMKPRTNVEPKIWRAFHPHGAYSRAGPPGPQKECESSPGNLHHEPPKRSRGPLTRTSSPRRPTLGFRQNRPAPYGGQSPRMSADVRAQKVSGNAFRSGSPGPPSHMMPAVVTESHPSSSLTKTIVDLADLAK